MCLSKRFQSNYLTFAHGKIVKWHFNKNLLCREGDKINWFSKFKEKKTHTHTPLGKSLVIMA